MKFFPKFLGVLLIFVFAPSSLKAQQAVGYDFLRTFVGARPSSMAGAFIAIPSDIHNIRYNPAGLIGIDKKIGTASYLNHLLDFQSGFLAYAQPFSKGTIAIALHFFDYGQFERKDANNISDGEFGANSLSFSLGYSKNLIKNVAFGASAKFIRFQIDNLSATAVAADLGLMILVPGRELTFGVGVFNLGSTTSAFIETKDDLPLNFQVGASKRLEHLPLFISGAVVKFKDEDVDFRFGGEFTLTEQLFLRVGYNSVGQDQKVDTSRDRLAGVSFGLGFKVNTFDIDYALSSFGEVGTLNRISLSGRF